MASARRVKLFMFLAGLTLLLIYYIQKLRKPPVIGQPMDFRNFNNVTGVRTLIVPNIIHFVHFDMVSIDFVTFICILSAFYNHRPSHIYFHSNVKVVHGKYFTTLMDVLKDTLVIHWMDKPTHVFGQKLTSVHHAADVARIKILMKYGGIFLDEDVFVVKNLNSFRHFECAVGWPTGQNIGNQVLVAHKDARFLQYYMDCYKEYRPTMWYYNAGEAPTQTVLKHQPNLVHRLTTEFGVENLAEQLYKQNWSGWINRHTIHLLQRHRNYLVEGARKEGQEEEFTEDNIDKCDCTFKTLVEQILEYLEEDGVSLKKTSKQLKKPSSDDTESDDSDYNELLLKFLREESPSLLKKYLSTELVSKLQNLQTTKYKSKLSDLIMSGLHNPDSSMGIYASEPEAYHVFSPLFDPIIKDYHKVKGEIGHPPTMWGDLSTIGNFNRHSNNVLSTRIRIARSIKGFPFNSKMTKEDYLNLEAVVKKALSKIGGSLAGQYISLSEMSPKDHEQLVSEHLMFGECDKYLKDGNACHHWPAGRGVFLSTDRALIIWVNEEDHLRIFSLQKGGDLGRVYSRLVEAVRYLEKHIQFERSSKLGYLTFCPSNVGTTLRASVHMKLPRLVKSGKLQEEAAQWGIQVRGTGGEHTAVSDGVVDLSNSRRLGLTEIEAVAEMYKGVAGIIQTENSMEE